VRFSGFTRVYEEGKDEESAEVAADASRNGSAPPAALKGAKQPRVRLPELTPGEPLDCRKLEPKQHFTEPPPRYTEASLVKALEDNGVGRPSTYSTIVDTIQARGYVTQQERRFLPTEIGIAVNDLLVEHFPKIVNLDFTATMEGDLDKVAVGNENWVALLRRFYGPFASELETAEKKLPRLELRDEPTDEVCPNCGRAMVIKTGRFGKFISCSGYPECKTTKPIVKDTGAKCPKDGGAIVERRSKKGRTFYGCVNYPNCDFVSWDRVVPQPCPVCGSYVVVKTRRGGNVHLECAADRAHDVAIVAAAQGLDDAPQEPELAPT
jgi:DNA topoisomerase-1